MIIEGKLFAEDLTYYDRYRSNVCIEPGDYHIRIGPPSKQKDLLEIELLANGTIT
jgi:hypothetical protein